MSELVAAVKVRAMELIDESVAYQLEMAGDLADLFQGRIEASAAEQRVSVAAAIDAKSPSFWADAYGRRASGNYTDGIVDDLAKKFL